MKIAFLDLDKTLYDGYLFFDWVKYLCEKKIISRLQLLKLEKILALYVAKLSSYDSAAKHISLYFSEILDGKDTVSIQNITDEFLQSVKNKYYEHTIPLIRFLKDKNYKVVFITNEPDFLAEIIKTQFGADDAVGLDIKIENNAFKVGYTNDLFSKSGKEEIVANYLKTCGTKKENSIAVGDSINDFGMLAAVGKGFLINHDHDLVEQAEKEGIVVCTKDNVLERIETFIYQ